MIWSPFPPVHTHSNSLYIYSGNSPTTILPPGIDLIQLPQRTLHLANLAAYTHQLHKEGHSSFVIHACQPCSTARTSLEVEDSSHHNSLCHHADHLLSPRATTALLRQLHTTKSPRDTAAEACVVLQRLPVEAAPCSCDQRRVRTTASPLETSALSAHRISRPATMARTSTSSSTAASSSAHALCHNSLAATLA